MMTRTAAAVSIGGMLWCVLCALAFGLGSEDPHSNAQDVKSHTAVQLAPKVPALLLGAAWHPEQWPEERWEQDLALMQAAGIHLVRVGEFAWSRMEPREGQYDFDWLERAVALAAKHGILTVLGTPTAAPPAWLTQKYPDTLLIDENGKRAEHGNRQQFAFTSPRYRQSARKIASEMAKRFRHNPNVIGWQNCDQYNALHPQPQPGPLAGNRTRYKSTSHLRTVQRMARRPACGACWGV